ncbi:MAG TPA: beta-propeller fold lactonase family protein [Burkholderiales bacterium]|nr:beta-propeller fold lactonase family protein [Burkholderiales bacterium]
MDRRTFNTALMSAAATSFTGCATGGAGGGGSRTAFYQSVGDRLTHWDVDVDNAALTQRAGISLPSNVQYVWPHPSRKYLVVSTSDAASGNAPNPGKVHRLCAVRVDAGGALALHGEPAPLPQRPIHNSVDASGAYALTCYNNPSNLTVHRINADGTIDVLVQQSSKVDVGIFAHQILTMPGNRSAVLVTRGNRPTAKTAEDPGALKVYHFRDGQLSPLANLPVGGKGGLGYGPRHLDFHPAQPWMYVSVESQNQLHMHRVQGDSLAPEPAYNKTTTVGTYDINFPQAAGGIHVHPNGRTVYVSNRANATVDFQGKRVFRGGENNIAVFSINQSTGEPTLVQNADPQSFHIRTFSIDPGGRILVAASIVDMNVRDGDKVRHVPAALTVFRIGGDGKLTFVRKYDVELGGKFQWWTGFVGLSAA